MPRIGLLTIGQSPRSDIAAPFSRFPDIEVLEAGALDDVSEDQWGALLPSADDVVYISKLRTGDAVRISREALLPRLAEKLDQLGNKVEAVVMACTGSFSELSTRTPMIYPDQLVSGVVRGLTFVSHLGLLVPLPEQIQHMREKWQDFPGRISVASSSPYDGSDPTEAAINLRDQGAELIVLDCMGYSPWHRDRVRAATELPVVLPQSLIAATVQECFSRPETKGFDPHV